MNHLNSQKKETTTTTAKKKTDLKTFSYIIRTGYLNEW